MAITMAQNCVDHFRSFNCESDWEPHGPCEATNAVPGSREKIDILAQRITDGLELWNKDDRCNWMESWPQIAGAIHRTDEIVVGKPGVHE